MFIFLPAGHAFAGDVGDVEIHGFISQGYLWTTDNNYLADTEKGSFEFNELGINFSTWLSADLRAGIQLFARDLGTIGNDEITIDWAYADYHWRDWLGLRPERSRSLTASTMKSVTSICCAPVFCCRIRFTRKSSGTP